MDNSKDEARPKVWPGSQMFPPPGWGTGTATAERADPAVLEGTVFPGPRRPEQDDAPYGTAPAAPGIPPRDRLAGLLGRARAAGARAGAWPAGKASEPSGAAPARSRSWSRKQAVAAGVAAVLLGTAAGAAVASSGGDGTSAGTTTSQTGAQAGTPDGSQLVPDGMQGFGGPGGMQGFGGRGFDRGGMQSFGPGGMQDFGPQDLAPRDFGTQAPGQDPAALAPSADEIGT